MSGVFKDSKTFVDMKCKKSAAKILKDFEKFMKKYKKSKNPKKNHIERFVKEHFEAGLEYEKWTPTDIKPYPSFLNNISSPGYKVWALQLNQYWAQLGRKQVKDVEKNPDRYSIIPMPNPAIFQSPSHREFYYFDNYFTIRGLLACQMYEVSVEFGFKIISFNFLIKYYFYYRLFVECSKTIYI